VSYLSLFFAPANRRHTLSFFLSLALSPFSPLRVNDVFFFLLLPLLFLSHPCLRGFPLCFLVVTFFFFFQGRLAAILFLASFSGAFGRGSPLLVVFGCSLSLQGLEVLFGIFWVTCWARSLFCFGLSWSSRGA